MRRWSAGRVEAEGGRESGGARVGLPTRITLPYLRPYLEVAAGAVRRGSGCRAAHRATATTARPVGAEPDLVRDEGGLPASKARVPLSGSPRADPPRRISRNFVVVVHFGRA
jgi:hypothetical protein